MRVVACIKQVPSSNKVRFDPANHTIIRSAKQSVVNPFDKHAVEEAVRIKEQLDCEVVVVSMGIPSVEALLRDSLARGADRAVLLSDAAFAGADTLATSKTLAAGIRSLGGASLVICGKMAVDGDTAQVGPELAENLNIHHITDVCEVQQITDRYIRVKKNTGRGFCILEARLPALITVTREINLPRLPTLAGVRRSLTAPVTLLRKDDLALGEDSAGRSGSATRVVRTYTPDRNAECVFIRGDAADQATSLLRIIKEQV